MYVSVIKLLRVMLILQDNRKGYFMKKLYTILLSVITAFSMVSCSPSSTYLEETTHQAVMSPTNVTDDTESNEDSKIESIVTVIPNKNEDLTLIEDIKSITITAAGDCTLGTDESFAYAGSFMDEFEKQNKDYGYFFKNVKDIFRNDDLTIVNLETTLTTATKKADKQFRFKGLPEFTEIIKSADIETVNIANNHTMDYLEKGYNDTIENLKAAEIGFFGNNIYITSIKGIKIGLLGYKGWSNGNDVKNQIKTDIENLKKDNCQLVIVSFHWGIERDNYPNSVQKDLGRFAIDIIPCSVSSIKNRNNYQPTPVYDEEAERILKRIEEYNKEF